MADERSREDHDSDERLREDHDSDERSREDHGFVVGASDTYASLPNRRGSRSGGSSELLGELDEVGTVGAIYLSSRWGPPESR
jgi:hypothetical protein